MATARPGTPGATGTPCLETPTAESHAGTARMRRAHSLPGGLGVLLPTRRLSPVTPVPPGELPAPKIPPDTLTVMADLQQLTQQAAGEENRRLLPLLASLTCRPEHLRLPVTSRWGAPVPPQPPGPCMAALWASPGRAFTEGVTVQPHPALCRDAGADAALDPLDMRELYRELGRVLPAERLQFHHEPLIELAAAAADLLPSGEQGPRNASEPLRRGDGRHGHRQTACLFDDYLEFITATGSDFLHAIFLHDGEEPVGAPWLHQELAPVEPYEGGSCVCRNTGVTIKCGIGGCPPPAPPRHRC